MPLDGVLDFCGQSQGMLTPPAIFAEGQGKAFHGLFLRELSAVMYLFAAFLVLFTAWMFLGWMFGEARDIRWLRNWCAGVFVVMAILICLGGGAMLARRMTQSSHRQTLEQFARLLEERAEDGRIQDVRDAISHLANKPDEWSTHSPDILVRIDEVTQALEKTALSKVAAKSSGQKQAH